MARGNRRVQHSALDPLPEDPDAVITTVEVELREDRKVFVYGGAEGSRSLLFRYQQGSVKWFGDELLGMTVEDARRLFRLRDIDAITELLGPVG